MIQLDPGHGGEQFRGELKGGALPGRGEIELARPGFRERDQVLHRVHRQRGMHDDKQRPLGDLDDRRKVADRIEL